MNRFKVLRWVYRLRRFAPNSHEYTKMSNTSFDRTTNVLGFIYLLLILNCQIKGYDSSMNCCFQVLKNHSVLYELSDPPGASCTSTWSAEDVAVVDELGRVDPNTVAYYEPQKLILKQNMNDRVKQVLYHQDCPHTRHAYKAECLDPCAAVDIPGSTQVSCNNSTEASGVEKRIIIVSIIITIVVVNGSASIIIIIIICCKRKGSAMQQII